MNARSLLGLAGLCLFALPRAEAVTVTFGPNHANDRLDVTLDVMRPIDGFLVESDRWAVTNPSSVVNVFCRDLVPLGAVGYCYIFERDYLGEIYFWRTPGIHAHLWEGLQPTVTHVSAATYRFEWNVPDSGTSLILAFPALALLLAFHRKSIGGG